MSFLKKAVKFIIQWLVRLACLSAFLFLAGKFIDLSVDRFYHVYIPEINFSKDGRYLTAISSQDNIFVWETDTGRIKYVFPMIAARDCLITVSPDSKYIAFKNENGITIVDTIEDRAIFNTDLLLNASFFYFSTDSKSLITDKGIVIDIENKEVIENPKQNSRGKSDKNVKFEYFQRRGKLKYYSDIKDIKITNIINDNTNVIPFKFKFRDSIYPGNKGRYFNVSYDGKIIATNNISVDKSEIKPQEDSSIIRLYDVNTLKKLSTFKIKSKDYVSSITVDHINGIIAIAYTDSLCVDKGSIILYSLRTGKKIRELELK